jgi:hypothetical protein
MTLLLHVLGWFIIIICCSYSIAIQAEHTLTGLQKFSYAGVALAIMYVVGVSLARFPGR